MAPEGGKSLFCPYLFLLFTITRNTTLSILCIVHAVESNCLSEFEIMIFALHGCKASNFTRYGYKNMHQVTLNQIIQFFNARRKYQIIVRS